MNNVSDYVKLVNEPWGRMFYDLLFLQLSIENSPKLKILDFGSGLGVTANHFANWHDVTAVEPDEEMIKNSRTENKYTQICGGIEKITDFEDNIFDMAFCHNVLEYIEDKASIFAELFRVLKKGGALSLVKHNRTGRVFHSAVFGNDPQKALELVNNDANDISNYLGTQYIYSNNDVVDFAAKNGGKVKNIFGMRTFWALGQDNSVKFTDDWYENMLTLENKVSNIDEYKQAAFYNHLIIEKTK